MRKKVNKKLIVALLSFVLLFGGTFGSSLAWLFANTEEVENEFTPSDINVELTETKPENKTAKMVPGWTIEKNPKATVEVGSEDCYLFVVVTETGVSYKVTTGEGEDAKEETIRHPFGNYLTYDIADGWETLQEKDEDGVAVYYRIIDGVKGVAGTEYSILKDDQVTVKNEVTKDQMNELETHNVSPELSFKAYAVQLWKTNKPTGDTVTDAQIKAAQFSAEQAWRIANGLPADEVTDTNEQP